MVIKSKEIATRLHALKVIHKKEDTYKSLATKFDDIRGKMNVIFDQKADVGKGIGQIKSNLDELLNRREELYEERRGVIHRVREAGAKIEMVDTQLNAIEFKRNRLQHSSERQRRYSPEKKIQTRNTPRQNAQKQRKSRIMEFVKGGRHEENVERRETHFR